MNKLKLNKILCDVAMDFVKELNCNNMESDEIYDKDKEYHSICKRLNSEEVRCLSYYDDKTKLAAEINDRSNRGAVVTVRQRFGNQRIDVYDSKRNFASVEYDENGMFSSSQIFKEDGIQLFNKLFNAVKNKMENK